jgi:hypothetical protein
MLIRGDQLNRGQRAIVLAAFHHRWTVENYRKGVYKCPHCFLEKIEFDRVECRQHHPTVPLVTDEEWLAKHAFHFVKDGSRLKMNKKFAETV